MQKIVFIINPISGTASKKSMPALIDKYIDKNRFDIEVIHKSGYAVKTTKVYEVSK